MKIFDYARELEFAKTKELPSKSEMLNEAMCRMNEDFCISKMGSTPVLIHKYAETDKKPLVFGRIDTEGTMDYLKVMSYQFTDNSGEIKRGKLDVFKEWRQSTRAERRACIKFDPSTTQEDGDYNLWRGFPVEKYSDVEPHPTYIEDFKHYVYNCLSPDMKEGGDYILNWLAHMVQYPQSKPGVAIAINSKKKGTGKSIMGDIMSKLLQSHFFRASSSHELLGQFTGHLANVLFLNAEEACFAGDSKATDRLKNIITDRQQTVENKGKDSFSVDSFCRLWITSNHEYFVEASSDERRFAVFNNDNSKGHQDTDYFAKVAVTDMTTNVTDKSKLVALFNFLKERDISDFQLIRDIPETEELLNQKEMSEKPLEQFIKGIRNGDVIDELNEQYHDSQGTVVKDDNVLYIKKTAFYDSFGRFQSKGFHSSKYQNIASNQMKKHLSEFGITEKAGGRCGTIKGVRYWEINLNESEMHQEIEETPTKPVGRDLKREYTNIRDKGFEPAWVTLNASEINSNLSDVNREMGTNYYFDGTDIIEGRAYALNRH